MNYSLTVNSKLKCIPWGRNVTKLINSGQTKMLRVSQAKDLA
ncbi:hypothetical protein AM1_1496 [Acaryochloris marina MBIC11017]|uniref:Uncharacterized protein n=1 Tax=Acaryochloris marina (strain MBIC 11017) TaxID=329726 RepID=B0C7Y1_ACAM1|nr:hypothetical protein AM1_1496 [Acaryochloris marina MBIC11017]